MDFRHYGDAYYLRIDPGEEIVETVLGLCRREGVQSATFSGIGGCGDAKLAVYDPDLDKFQIETAEGMLELVSLMGNIAVADDGELYHHTHAMYSFKQDGAFRSFGGHLISSVVRNIAEVELRPVIGGVIKKKLRPGGKAGTWEF
ncbi:MAG: DNA-binding protein [Mogibacterium sp.]|nr:DNA-binding protein [Mogibacterium sp.]